MRKPICLIGSLILLFCAIGADGAAKNPNAFVLADIGSVESMDPARCYDVAGSSKLWTVYEALVFFDEPHTGKFVPVLATEVPTVANGRISADGKTYAFKMRKGVKFREGGELTAEDVAYALKRSMICDPVGGPMWMLLEAMTGKGNTRKGDKIIPGIFEEIDRSIEVKGDTVILHLPKPYPPLMGILCYSSSCIIDKEWAMANGCWDGDIENAAKYNKPPTGKEPLEKIANGTGPYRMKLWEAAKQFVFERFEGYWDPQPKLKKGHCEICARMEHQKTHAGGGRPHCVRFLLPQGQGLPFGSGQR